MVNVLLEHGVEVDVNAIDKRGRTPLSWAMARENDVDMGPVLKALREHGGADAAL